MAEANVAVLIDYENVGMDAIQYLLDRLSDVGRVIIKRAYGDWSAKRSSQDQLIELGIEAVHQYRSNNSGKNSSDIRLAIEAIDLLHVSPIDTFVIVSSDSDFVPLVGKLRSSGKTVIGSGRREATSSTLVRSCDRYIFLDEAKAVVNSSPRRYRGRNGPSINKADVYALLTRAHEASTDDSGSVGGSKLYQTMCRIDPGFDFKAIGYRSFTQFLESFGDQVGITRPSNGGDIQVQLSQAAPKEASKEAPKEAPNPKNRINPSARYPVTATSTPEKKASSARPVEEVIINKTQNSESASINNADASKSKPQILPPPQPALPSKTNTINWEREIDSSWNKRQSSTISGRAAATDAAKVLGVSKLSTSSYPSLDKLLSASTLLQLNWKREGNTIVKK